MQLFVVFTWAVSTKLEAVGSGGSSSRAISMRQKYRTIS